MAFVRVLEAATAIYAQQIMSGFLSFDYCAA